MILLDPTTWCGTRVTMRVKKLEIGKGKPSPAFVSVEVLEAVSDSGVYVHSGYEPRHGFKNMHFLPWRLIDGMKVVLPAKTKEAV
jgi:hypothetical protein